MFTAASRPPASATRSPSPSGATKDPKWKTGTDRQLTHVRIRTDALQTRSDPTEIRTGGSRLSRHLGPGPPDRDWYLTPALRAPLRYRPCVGARSFPERSVR